MRVALWCISIVCASDLYGQAERLRRAMAPSLEQQQRSVQQQMQSLGRNRPAVFWTAPVSAIPLDRDCNPLRESELEPLIAASALEQNIDPQLVREVARQESAFYPCAVSPKGAAGLMQLMPQTQAQFSVRDAFDPSESLRAGTRLLAQLLARYHGNLDLVLSAYNAGIARVDPIQRIPAIPETQQYVREILQRLR